MEGNTIMPFTIENPNQEKKLTTSQKVYKTIEPYFEPALEAGASTAGAIAFAPLAPPFGSVFGGGGGFAAAKRLEKFIEHSIGLGEPESILEGFKATGEDFLLGTLYEGGGQITSAVGSKVLGKVLAPEKSRMTPDAVKRLELSKKFGLEATPAEVTLSKPLSQFESLLEKIPFSSGKIQDRRLLQLLKLTKERELLLSKNANNEAIERVGLKIQDNVDDYIKSLAGKKTEITNDMRNILLSKLGTEETFGSLGSSAKEILKTTSQAWQTKGTELYLKAGSNVPEGTVIKVDNLQDTAIVQLKRLIQRPKSLRNNVLIRKLLDLSGMSEKTLSVINNLPKEQADQVLNQIKQGYTWEGLQGTIQELNDLISSSDFAVKQGQAGVKGLSSTSGGIYKLLKKSIIADIEKFSNLPGNENVKIDLDIANEFWSKGKKVYESPIIQKILRTNPENLVDIIIKPKSGTDIKTFKSAVGNNGFELLKKGFTKKLLNNFESGKKFLSQLNRYDDETLRSLYSDKEIGQLKRLGEVDIKLDKELVANPLFRTLVNQQPQNVVDIIVKPNNTTNIDMIEKIVGKDGVKEIAAKHLEKILELNKHELFSPGLMLTQLKRYGNATNERLLGKGTWKELQEFAKVSEVMRGAEIIAGNPSGTAQNLLTFVVGGMAIKNPIKNIYLFITPRTLAQMYLSKPAMKWLTEGINVPAGTKEGIQLFTKLSLLINKYEQSPEVKEKIQQDRFTIEPNPQRFRIGESSNIERKE